jgi:hypothetical protein
MADPSKRRHDVERPTDHTIRRSRPARIGACAADYRGCHLRHLRRRGDCARLVLAPDWKPIVWTEEGRKKGQTRG